MTHNTKSADLPFLLMPPRLDELVTVPQYQAARANVFQSVDSLLWQIRKHHQRLVDEGALVRIVGRNLIHPRVADAVFQDLGKENAERYRTDTAA